MDNRKKVIFPNPFAPEDKVAEKPGHGLGRSTEIGADHLEDLPKEETLPDSSLVAGSEGGGAPNLPHSSAPNQRGRERDDDRKAG